MAKDEFAIILVIGGIVLIGGMYFLNPQFKAQIDSMFGGGFDLSGQTPAQAVEYQRQLSQAGTNPTASVSALNYIHPNVSCDPSTNTCVWVSNNRRGSRVSAEPRSTLVKRARDAYCKLYGC